MWDFAYGIRNAAMATPVVALEITPKQGSRMFAFYSSRLGCLGSIVVSIIASLILAAVMYSCSGRGP